MVDSKIIEARLTGKNLFQVRYIKLSYRIRGKVARTQTNKVAKSIVFKIICISINRGIDPINRVTVRRLINRIFIYSAIKIKANIPALYSTLNPETNSDSPSAKSKGVRFVSAKFVINHRISRGKIIMDIQVYPFIMLRSMDL
jgi:hypothetical protein